MSEHEMKWLPCRWLDECVPDIQADPNAFIRHDEEHGWHLVPVEDQEVDYDGSVGTIRLAEGQVVKFYACELYGDFELTVRDDGSFETDREIPAKANCFRVDRDTDTLQPSLSELVTCGYGISGELEPGLYAIDAYWWSEEEYAFTFSIIDGKGQLTQVGAVQ